MSDMIFSDKTPYKSCMQCNFCKICVYKISISNRNYKLHLIYKIVFQETMSTIMVNQTEMLINARFMMIVRDDENVSLLCLIIYIWIIIFNFVIESS